MINSGKLKPSYWMLILLLCVNENLALGQVNKMAFEKYGVAEGLPEEFVTDMVQDDKGFIWLSTQNGLVKYDGYKFHVFKKSTNPKDTNSLQLSSINGGLIKARDGKIWLGAYSQRLEIASFDPVTGKFKSYHYTEKGKEKSSLNKVASLLLEDSKGNIWFQSYSNNSQTLGRLQPGTGKIEFYSITPNVQWSKIGAVAEVNKNLWVLEKSGQFMQWNVSKDEFEPVVSDKIANTLKAYKDTLQRLYAGNENRILLTSRTCLFVFDARTQKQIATYHKEFVRPGTTSTDTLTGAREDKNGHIWVTHLHGLITRIDPKTNKISSFRPGQGFPIHPNQISKIENIQIVELHKDGIWFQVRLKSDFASDQYLFYTYRTGKFELYDSKFNIPSHPETMIGYFDFFRDKTDLLWLYTRPNLYKNAPKNHQMDWHRYSKEKPQGLPNDTITCLFEDSKSRLWVGTANGLALYNTSSDDFRVFRNQPSNSFSLSNNGIISISEDTNGNIWIGTANGLNKWQEDAQNFRRYFYDSKTGNPIVTVYSDHKKRLWVSIWNKGVLAMDPGTGKILNGFSTADNFSNGLSSKQIFVFYHDSKGNMWLGDPYDNNYGLYKLGPNGKRFQHFMPVLGDTSALSSNEIIFVDEDSKKNLWIGTDDGLNLYDHKTDKFKIIDLKNNWSVSAMAEDKKGKIWFATYAGGGLMQVNPKNGAFKSFGEIKGLLHNDLDFRASTITKDNSGKFWLPNQRGLSVFDPETESYTNYFSKDGFQLYERGYRVLKSKNGDIWIGGNSGLNHIVPGQLLKKDKSLPNVVITGISINGQSYDNPDGKIFEKAVPYTREIELGHSQKDLRFDFVALHFLRSEDNLYSWKLENYDQNWSEPSHSRTVSYTNLSPGKYIFKVKGSNADGVWNEIPTTIVITILPPWWKTWWAYTIYALFFLGALRIFSMWRERRLRHENEVLELKVNHRTQQLQESIESLKSTQSQLVQSEKMASLGELTAGIAHEIQNPLNFVNNFSEVSNELIDEMNEELDRGDIDEAKAIASDIKQNLEKINHHGKRADAIVKGMLQHSRSNSGVKDPTDINALADEYLRLAYHGLRAKDKSFNATLKTDFDETIGKIDIIPQDIGRVILNLITNAFYAVDEKKKQNPEGYEPTVTVSTEATFPPPGGPRGGLISVKDNGPGIPQKVLDKIFQPFFTTKPTGQGTGLGLSLAYDIVKAHGGELKVETRENEGSIFTIMLPAIN